MILNETFILANGHAIPKLGLGTWFIEDGSAARAVREAVEIGYRNIDTAQAYGNEHGVGKGVRSSGVPREELFISSKVAAEIKDFRNAAAAIDASLATMGLEYLDLMLIHSPQPWNEWRGGSYAEGNREVWRALEEAQKAGKIRSIGVSNFEQQDLENILSDCTVPPQVNQVLLHVGNTPDDLLIYCWERNILIEALAALRHLRISDYGKSSRFPVFSGR